MKVCLINTYDSTGGAAIACRRLLEALQENGTEASMLVASGKTDDPSIIRLDRSLARKAQFHANLFLERVQFKPFHNRIINEFYFSLASTGMDISDHPAVRDADILHLHWINLGFLSISSLRKLVALGKPMVWTLHDMWAFTGGCHYAGDCQNFRSGCGHCMFLKTPGAQDLSSRLNREKDFFGSIHFVTCSEWLKDEAMHSRILDGSDIRSIPNPIDATIFSPSDKASAKQAHQLDLEKKYILFGAANLDDERKGIRFLLKALQFLAPKLRGETTELLLFGKNDLEAGSLPLKVHSLGSLSSMEAIANVYRASEMFVIPSLQDNLPNTIMESMACGTPVVGFKTGGIPEMIDHKQNGYVAAYRDVEDLAEGMHYVLKHPELGAAARRKVLDTYLPSQVAAQYQELYLSLLSNRD